jgi:formate--tetrahydrofolate ligase
MVATIRALKSHGGQALEDLAIENLTALEEGFANLKQHMENIAKYGLPAVVCMNHFSTDTENETKLLKELCLKEGYEVAFCSAFRDGGEGAVELAQKVLETLNTKESHYKPIYDVNSSITEKIETICKEIYRADKVEYTELALKQISEYERLGYDKTPICIAKTPQSFSDDPSVLNTPRGFTITIREIRLSAGANFLVPLTGAIMTMPGLPKVPAAVKMEDQEI